MVKTLAVSTEGEYGSVSLLEMGLNRPLWLGPEEGPKDLGGSCMTKLVMADGRDCGSDTLNANLSLNGVV